MSAAHSVITIDGPAASGKSSIARLVAQRLGRTYVNTGNMYRAMTWAVLQAGVNPQDADAVRAAAADIVFESPVVEGKTEVCVSGRMPTEAELNSDPVNRAVSFIASVDEVRDRLVAEQRALAAIGPLVMEGRDIGSVVFPESPHKIYVDASEEVRASRRGAQGRADQIAERDRIDKQRKNSPLVIPAGAIVIDNSHITLDQAVDQVIAALQLS